MKNKILIAVVLCIAICGCTVRSLKTSGELVADQRVSAVKVVVDWTLPKEIQITRHANGYKPTISVNDRIKAVSNVKQFVTLFNTGFKNRFPAIASKYGLNIEGASSNAPNLKVSILALKMNCSDFGCASTLVLQGELLGESEISFWQFSSQVGQPVVEAAISDELFDTFAVALLDAMKKDHVIK